MNYKNVIFYISINFLLIFCYCTCLSQETDSNKEKFYKNLYNNNYAILVNSFDNSKGTLAIHSLSDSLLATRHKHLLFLTYGLTNSETTYFFKHILHINDTTITIISNDSIYTQFSKSLESGIVVFDKRNDKFIFYPLTYYSTHQLINSLPVSINIRLVDSLDLKQDSIPLGSIYKISSEKDSILFILDNKFNNLSSYNLKNGKKLNSFYIQIPLDKLVRKYLTKDSTKVQYAIDNADASATINFHTFNLMSFYNDNGNFFLIGQYYMTYLHSLNAIKGDSIDLYPYLLVLTLSQNLDSLNCSVITATDLPEDLDYWFYNNFIIQDSLLFCPVRKFNDTDLEDSCYFLMTLQLDKIKNEWSRPKILKYTLPKQFIKNKTFYDFCDFFYYKFHDSTFCQFKYLPIALNLERGYFLTSNDTSFRKSKFLADPKINHTDNLFYEVIDAKSPLGSKYLYYILRKGIDYYVIVMDGFYNNIFEKKIFSTKSQDVQVTIGDNYIYRVEKNAGRVSLFTYTIR